MTENDQLTDSLITKMTVRDPLLLPLEERKKLGEALEQSLKEGIHQSKGKVFLANQAYDTVDKYIRRLDNDMNRFQVALARHQAEKTGIQSVDFYLVN